jgi:hypothetical protein
MTAARRGGRQAKLRDPVLISCAIDSVYGVSQLSTPVGLMPYDARGGKRR